MNLPDSEMMVRINRAYETNDLKTLLRIQEGSADIASMDKSESVIVQKKRIEWSIRRTKRFIGDLTIEISRVKSSEGYRLKTTFDDCQKNGKDLFTDLIRAVDKRKIQLNEPLKSLGEFQVAVRLHRDVTAEITVKVVNEAASATDTETLEQAPTPSE